MFLTNVRMGHNIQVLNARQVFTLYWMECHSGCGLKTRLTVWHHMTCAVVLFDACHYPNIYYLLFSTLHRTEVGVDGAESESCYIVVDVLWLVLYIVWGTAIIFTFSLSYKGGGIVMACSSLTKSNFTSEQSLSFPLCVACSVLKLGSMNKFSVPSLLAQRWRLSCAKTFTGRLLDLQHFVNCYKSIEHRFTVVYL